MNQRPRCWPEASTFQPGRLRQDFGPHRQQEHHDEGKYINPEMAGGAGPAGEEQLHILTPEEAGVHGHGVLVLRALVVVRGRHWHLHCCFFVVRLEDYLLHGWRFPIKGLMLCLILSHGIYI